MDLQEILSQVITSTNEIFEAEAGSVALIEPSGQELVIRAAVGAGAEAVRGMCLPITKGVIGWVATHETPALIADVDDDPRFNRAIDQESGFRTRSILCAPLQVNNHTIGVIELMNMRRDYLSDNGLKILRVIADHAALAIENTQLLAETRRRSEEQVMLFEAMTIVTSDLALETVLDAVSHQVAEALTADICIISRWDETNNNLHLMQTYVNEGATPPGQEVRSLSDLPPLATLLTAQSSLLLERGAPDLPPGGSIRLEELNVQTLLLIPLIYRSRTIGLVEIGRAQPTASLTPNEIRLAKTMTAQAAVVIEHARLYDEVMHRLAEAKVLQEVMVAAASTLDFDQVLSGTIKALHRTLGIERLGFFLPSKDGETIEAHPATIGFSSEVNAGLSLAEETIRIPIDGSAAGWVIRNSKPLLIPDVRQSADYYEIIPSTLSELCVPVMVKNRVVAVLNAESSQTNAFDPDDLHFFMAIAAELAVALENADLFEEIRAAEANYRDLFDNANDFILTLDSNFRISSANKMALQSTGYSLEEITGRHVRQFVKPEYFTKLYQLLKARLTADSTAQTFELPIVSKEGHEILLEINFRVRREHGRLVSLHCIGRDITQRRRLEQQLQQTEKLSTVGKLVAGVAHELNNPLTSIIGYSSMLQKGDVPRTHREDLQVIFHQAQRARHIVRDLLTFARKIDLDTKPVDINDIISSSLSASKPQLQSSSIQVVTALDFSLPQTMADPHQLEQVFINLIDNAIHALDGLTGSRRLTIETRRTGACLQINFADNGPGIPPNILNRIFDPFFSTKNVGKGTGLGLSICFGIISEHQGTIKAENMPTGGARFHIELPIKQPTLYSPSPPPESSMAEATSDSLHILAVDDEATLLKLLQRILKQLGHNVDTAIDGQTALEKIQGATYDLVLCDILMPDIMGPELYEQVRQDFPALDNRFIFITGNVVDIDTRLFLEKSGLPWLSKPFLPSDLEKIINETIHLTDGMGAS